MKNNVYPCKPQFYYIKVGFKGVNIIYAYFRDVDGIPTIFLMASILFTLQVNYFNLYHSLGNSADDKLIIFSKKNKVK